MHLIELETLLFADTILEIGDDQLNCHSFAVQDLEACLQSGLRKGKFNVMKINDVNLNSAKAMLESIYNTDGFIDDRSRRSKTSLNVRCYVRVWNLWTEGKLQRDTR